jgi:uncharacterized SAM-binding protein YcdF (DUF218 family)
VFFPFPVPPRVSLPGGRLRRFIPVAALLLMAAGGLYGFVNLGPFMAPEDALEKADVIFVLAGTLAERPLEAYDLYRAGYAPRILVTRATAEQAAFEAIRRGATVPFTYELNRRMLLDLGVPASAIVEPDRLHDNTAQEAETLRALAQQYRWRRVILVSSKYHLRRASLAVRRELNGLDVRVIRRGSRYDAGDPVRWWSRRSDIRWLLSEVPKLLAYSVGLGG